jgi:mono/diheme cytochrome c family protein
MSSHDSNATWPGKLGLGLAIITAAGLLGALGLFGVNLLGSMLIQPERGESQAAATPAVPAAPAVVGKAPAAPATPAAAPAAEKTDPALAALMETGKQTFMLCAACHGTEGKAVVPNMAPNLAGSAYVNGPSERLAMIVLNGIQYPGQYLGQMISWKAQLSDEQIAGVLTYIRSNFGNSAPAITPDKIKAAREKHGARNTPYPRAELDQVTANL